MGVGDFLIDIGEAISGKSQLLICFLRNWNLVFSTYDWRYLGRLRMLPFLMGGSPPKIDTLKSIWMRMGPLKNLCIIFSLLRLAPIGGTSESKDRFCHSKFTYISLLWRKSDTHLFCAFYEFKLPALNCAWFCISWNMIRD